MNSRTPPESPVPYWLWVFGALLLTVPAVLVLAARVAAAYGESPSRGERALGAVMLGVVVLVVLVLIGFGLSTVLRFLRLRSVSHVTADPVYAGRSVQGFAEAVAAMGKSWSARHHFYTVSLGQEGLTVWTGTRAPTPEFVLSWDEFSGAGTAIVQNYTGRFNVLALYPRSSSLPLLPLALVDWTMSSLSARRVRAIASSLPVPRG